ncbi:hypothetical protein K3162_10110 [Qipengyuania xiapuensis]|uniref:Uncharacterized protein n=1 Tax=Qipengyuania xiapuensis TaxID=2867236 RepID=A0ABX8ZW77_9SPHN|nr:hypothetical protein [Qipengyuania xiapuensis]QZD91903.1 hypothetical protein K3162_10110 [Qipengyuania xiapuensis]
MSFHHLKYLDDPKDPESARGYSDAEFQQLCDSIKGQPAPDLTDPITYERVRSGYLIPFYDFKPEGKRLAFGRFKAPYTGHSFENSDHGKIEAYSINQRLFNYMLYHAKDGRIYAGAQYLGNYGGWKHLANGLKSFFDQKNKVLTTSIRSQGYAFDKVYPKEIKLKVSKKSKSIDGKNVLTNQQLITLQKGADGQQFEQAARSGILSLMKKPLEQRGEELRKALKAAGLQEFSDYDIEDCVVVVDITGGSKSYHIFENGLRATKFYLNVELNEDGWPFMEPTRTEMKKAFKEHVLEEIG